MLQILANFCNLSQQNLHYAMPDDDISASAAAGGGLKKWHLNMSAFHISLSRSAKMHLRLHVCGKAGFAT